MGIVGMVCGDRKTSIVVVNKLGQKGVGWLNGTDASQAHLLDQSVLQGLISSFDTPFCLWGVGVNRLDVQGLEGAGKLGEFAFLIGVIDPKDTVFIAINGHRTGMLGKLLVEGDPSPDGQGKIQLKRGIEVGHIFQLGDKYSKAMNASVLDDQGEAVLMKMGCYGMGVSRLVAAIIEQHHDQAGIIWPDTVAPFNVILIPINAHKSAAVNKTTEQLYQQLLESRFDVLLDDRPGLRPGVKFADAELLGIPHRVVIGDKGLARGLVEYTCRRSGETQEVVTDSIFAFLNEAIKGD